MRQIITRNRINFPSHLNWKFWISLALIVKSIFFIFKLLEFGYTGYSFSNFGGDTSSYLGPIENLIANGEYYDDFRMPGYGWLYFLLRIPFSLIWAQNFLVFFQVILSAISVYVLGLVSLKIFEKTSYFLLTYFLYLISTFVSLSDNFLLTESFCTASLIFSIYFLLKGEKSNFLSGLFLTWAIFLRPVFFPLILLYGLYIILSYKRNSNKLKSSLLKNLFFLFISFILIDGAWITRNYLKYSKFYPLTKTVYYPGTNESIKGALFRFMNSFGGSMVWWLPGSEITFFIPLPEKIKLRKETILPDYIYTKEFNYDSLLLVKNMIHLTKSDSISTLDRQLLEKQVISKLDRYSNSIKTEKPFLYYIQSRIHIFKTFFIHSGTYNLFNKASFELNRFEYSIKVFYSLLYVFVVIGGYFGLITFLFSWMNNIKTLLISCIGLYSALVFPIILKMDEYRYFVPGYPIFIIGATYVTITLYSVINRRIKL